MKFGIFYELQLPRPWDADSEYQLFHDALDQIELADRLGYDYAWEVEHHFLEEYSHCSAPEVFLAAASQRTKNIRLGHGIVQLTTNHPARVAERVSTLDLRRHGRVELGIGEGSTSPSCTPSTAGSATSARSGRTPCGALLPMFCEEGWEYHGEYFDFPLRNVVPKPLQKPHPPLWVACSPARHHRDGRPPRAWARSASSSCRAEAAEAWVNHYYNAFMKRAGAARRLRSRTPTSPSSAASCAPRPTRRRMAKAEGWTFFQFALLLLQHPRPGRAPARSNLWDEYQAWQETAGRPEGRSGPGGLIGSPETAARAAAQVRGSPTSTRSSCSTRPARTRHEDICASLELFAREVMPEFQDREPQHQEWKQAVLAGEIKLDEIDTAPYNVPTNQTPTKTATPAS